MALGAPVIADPAGREVGTYDIFLTRAANTDPLFRELPPSFKVQLGHKDRATAVPSGAVHLASSARCSVQALRVGDTVYATQFNPELTETCNKQRFQHYLEEYRHSYGDDDLAPDDLAFAPSPHASTLLPAFMNHL